MHTCTFARQSKVATPRTVLSMLRYSQLALFFYQSHKGQRNVPAQKEYSSYSAHAAHATAYDSPNAQHPLPEIAVELHRALPAEE